MTIKVGPLPNGAVCIASQDIGKFNVRVIEEKSGVCWLAYSHDKTRLESKSYEAPAGNRLEAFRDYYLICHVLQNAHACFRQSILEAIGESVR